MLCLWLFSCLDSIIHGIMSEILHRRRENLGSINFGSSRLTGIRDVALYEKANGVTGKGFYLDTFAPGSHTSVLVELPRFSREIRLLREDSLITPDSPITFARRLHYLLPKENGCEVHLENPAGGNDRMIMADVHLPGNTVEYDDGEVYRHEPGPKLCRVGYDQQHGFLEQVILGKESEFLFIQFNEEGVDGPVVVYYEDIFKSMYDKGSDKYISPKKSFLTLGENRISSGEASKGYVPSSFVYTEEAEEIGTLSHPFSLQGNIIGDVTVSFPLSLGFKPHDRMNDPADDYWVSEELMLKLSRMHISMS
jgi:hypothetical protein